jgi:hypothetical protein
MTDDLKARMKQEATYGYMPHAARLALQEGAARIEALEAQLAARDAEIAGWLRRQSSTGDFFADAIERGEHLQGGE